MPLCPHHYCRLQDEFIPNTRPLGAQYLPLDGKEREKPDYVALDYEAELTDTLYAYLVLPFEDSPNPETDNLARAMENAGLLNEDTELRLCRRVGVLPLLSALQPCPWGL